MTQIRRIKRGLDLRKSARSASSAVYSKSFPMQQDMYWKWTSPEKTGRSGKLAGGGFFRIDSGTLPERIDEDRVALDAGWFDAKTDETGPVP